MNGKKRFMRTELISLEYSEIFVTLDQAVVEVVYLYRQCDEFSDGDEFPARFRSRV